MDNRTGAPPPPIDDSLNRARTATNEAIGTVKDTAREASEGIKDTLRDAKHSLQDKARGVMGDAQAKAADQTRTAANTLRDSAQGLNGDLPWMNTALNKTADGFDHLSSALNRGDIGQTLNAVTEFARRQPALFMGLSVAAGFALARVGKTAFEDMRPDNQTRDPSEPEVAVAEAVAPYAPVKEF